MSKPYYPWYLLAKQLPEKNVSLTIRIEALGGRSEKIVNREARRSVLYRFYDKDGNIVATTISNAWRWVCIQHGITEPLPEDMPVEGL